MHKQQFTLKSTTSIIITSIIVIVAYVSLRSRVRIMTDIPSILPTLPIQLTFVCKQYHIILYIHMYALYALYIYLPQPKPVFLSHRHVYTSSIYTHMQYLA